MTSSFIIIKRHESYYRDAVLLGVVGFFSAIIFYVLLAFTDLVIGAYGLLVVAFGLIYKIKAQLKPESFEIKPVDQIISIWRRSEFKGEDPHERELLRYEKLPNGIKIVAKELGASSVTTSFTFENADYGESNLNLLCTYIDDLKDPQQQTLTKHTKIRYKPRTFSVDSVGYIVTIALFISIDISLNEDPNRYTFLHSIVSPVDYSIRIPSSYIQAESDQKLENVISTYEVERNKVLKIFPQRYVSIEDFANSLVITHEIDAQDAEIILHFSSAYDETKLKRVYDLIADDIVSQVNQS